MTQALLVSNAILWVVVVLLACVVAALARQIGVLHERVEAFPYVLSPALGITYQVGKLPYAVLLDASGVVRSRGLVNTREHLESLFEAHERGVASIQDFLRDAEEHDGAVQR